MPKAEVDKVSDVEYVIDALKSGAVTFGELTDQFVDFVETGGALIDPAILQGIPFGIIGVTYREGFSRAIRGQMLKGDYASLEIMIADEATLNGSGMDWVNRGIKPLQIGVLNDGSTGIRRMQTKYLHLRGYVSVVDKPEDEVVAEGKLGESDYDIPFTHWHEIHKGERSQAEDGMEIYELQFDRMVIARRGTRVSKYPNPAKKGEMIETWYLA